MQCKILLFMLGLFLNLGIFAKTAQPTIEDDLNYKYENDSSADRKVASEENKEEEDEAYYNDEEDNYSDDDDTNRLPSSDEEKAPKYEGVQYWKF